MATRTRRRRPPVGFDAHCRSALRDHGWAAEGHRPWRGPWSADRSLEGWQRSIACDVSDRCSATGPVVELEHQQARCSASGPGRMAVVGHSGELPASPRNGRQTPWRWSHSNDGCAASSGRLSPVQEPTRLTLPPAVAVPPRPGVRRSSPGIARTQGSGALRSARGFRRPRLGCCRFHGHQLKLLALVRTAWGRCPHHRGRRRKPCPTPTLAEIRPPPLDAPYRAFTTP